MSENRRLDYRFCEGCGGPVVDYGLHNQGVHALFHTIPKQKERIDELETLWIEYLTGANLYSDNFGGVEIPEELSGELDIGLPLARKIYKALGGEP